MALTVAILAEDTTPDITQYSAEINATGEVQLPITSGNKIIEVYKLLLTSISSTGNSVFGQANGLIYVTLNKSATSAIYMDFGETPLILPEEGENPYVTNYGAATTTTVTLWYRLIDPP